MIHCFPFVDLSAVAFTRGFSNDTHDSSEFDDDLVKLARKWERRPIFASGLTDAFVVGGHADA
jgi:hypothetical protein